MITESPLPSLGGRPCDPVAQRQVVVVNSRRTLSFGERMAKPRKSTDPATAKSRKNAESGAAGPVAGGAPEERPHVAGRIMARLRNYFLAGILVTAPIGITVYLVWTFVSIVDGWVTPLIPPRYNPQTYLPFGIPGFGLVVAILGLILAGFLTANVLGRLFVHTSDRMMARMPVVRGVYSAVKQLTETVFGKQAAAFREVVLIEYPRRGIWGIGFITGTTEGEIQELTEDEVLNVFVPTTPNPTSGFLLFVPRSELVVLSMTVEEGIKLIISGGIVTPPDRRPAEVRARTRGVATTHKS
jgi:uncharacterized membrane protein